MDPDKFPGRTVCLTHVVLQQASEDALGDAQEGGPRQAVMQEEDTKEADGDEKGADDDNAPETPSPQERGTGKRHTDADEDDEDEYASAAEDEENEEEEGEDDLEPDSPTTGYQKGGLGVGSRFFSPEGVRCVLAMCPPPNTSSVWIGANSLRSACQAFAGSWDRSL